MRFSDGVGVLRISAQSARFSNNEQSLVRDERRNSDRRTTLQDIGIKNAEHFVLGAVFVWSIRQ